MNAFLTAYREGAFGTASPAPWLGWIMLLEDCERSRRPVGVAEPHFRILRELRDTRDTGRYEICYENS